MRGISFYGMRRSVAIVVMASVSWLAGPYQLAAATDTDLLYSATNAFGTLRIEQLNEESVKAVFVSSSGRVVEQVVFANDYAGSLQHDLLLPGGRMSTVHSGDGRFVVQTVPTNGARAKAVEVNYDPTTQTVPQGEIEAVGAAFNTLSIDSADLIGDMASFALAAGLVYQDADGIYRANEAAVQQIAGGSTEGIWNCIFQIIAWVIAATGAVLACGVPVGWLACSFALIGLYIQGYSTATACAGV